jgi:hypothetical protein
MATATEKFRILGVEHAAILMDSTPTPGTVTEHDLHFVNTVNFDVQQQDIAFEGDQQTVRKYIMNGITINVTCDTVDVKAVSEAFNKSTVVGDGPSGNGIPVGTTRIYFGDLAETSGVKVGFLAQTHADALTAQTVDILDVVIPMSALTIFRPPNLGFNAKGQMNLIFAGEKTTSDVTGDPLPEVPADGCFWYLDYIAP